jgi:hypothetical protein
MQIREKRKECKPKNAKKLLATDMFGKRQQQGI